MYCIYIREQYIYSISAKIVITVLYTEKIQNPCVGLMIENEV